MEIFKEIQGFEGLYEISNLGNIKNVIKNKLLKFGKHNQGYLQVSLSKNNKKTTFKIHRLIAIYFIDNPNNYKIINHVDGNKLNNSIENLEWCTSKHNNEHAYKLGLRFMTSKNLNILNKKVINIETNIVYESAKEVAIKHNLVYGTLINKLNGRRTNNTNFKYLDNV